MARLIITNSQECAFHLDVFIIIILSFKKRILYEKYKRSMLAEIGYPIILHKEGKISDSALDKALDALQPAQTVEQVEKRNIIRYSNCGKSKSTTS